MRPGAIELDTPPSPPQQRFGDGFWADVSSGSRHFRLFSQVDPSGIVAAVYDLDDQKWMAVDTAEDLVQAKAKAKKMLLDLAKDSTEINWIPIAV